MGMQSFTPVLGESLGLGFFHIFFNWEGLVLKIR